MSTELDFEKLYKISLTAMRLNKIHPDIPRTKTWYFISALNQAVFTFVFLLCSQNVLLSARRGDISQACQFGVLSIVYVIITVQKITILANRNMFNKLIKTMKEDFKTDRPDDERKIVLKHALIARKVCVMWLILSILAGSLFPIKHIILEIYTYFEKGEFVLLEFYPAVYPSIIEEHKFHPLVFTLLYVLLFSFTMNSVVIYIAMMPFGPICILHACGQLAIVKKKIEELDVRKIQESEEKIRTILQILLRAYKFVNDINKVLGLIHEVIIRTVTILLPLTWWIVRTGYESGEISSEFISFIFGGLLMCSTLCHYGQQLRETGNDVASAIYLCGWEKTYNQSVRNSVLIMLHRSQQTVVIRSLFHEFGMEALSDLFRQSYAFLNLMNAMWK